MKRSEIAVVLVTATAAIGLAGQAVAGNHGGEAGGGHGMAGSNHMRAPRPAQSFSHPTLMAPLYSNGGTRPSLGGKNRQGGRYGAPRNERYGYGYAPGAPHLGGGFEHHYGNSLEHRYGGGYEPRRERVGGYGRDFQRNNYGTSLEQRYGAGYGDQRPGYETRTPRLEPRRERSREDYARHYNPARPYFTGGGTGYGYGRNYGYGHYSYGGGGYPSYGYAYAPLYGYGYGYGYTPSYGYTYPAYGYGSGCSCGLGTFGGYAYGY